MVEFAQTNAWSRLRFDRVSESGASADGAIATKESMSGEEDDDFRGILRRLA